jgi:hypothetical protein
MSEMTYWALLTFGGSAMPVAEDCERERQHRDSQKNRYEPLNCGSWGHEREGVLRACWLRRASEVREVGNRLLAVYGG